ncbi:kinase domain protein [Actinomyces naeslundii str. Howell 279]|uniref:non-specific serine/threonine protein kinase n=1 Tax=Actinomyces naeslundii (strain ATCC 12104 / DSM 43013 / CCUG 2238 / JCM 8349 / NCTC 10301 / Howell 279) TaxID=1115803 RepID=J3JJM0_ACTNH|nr:kinase domain protein [Actinomyces naeslundii str. Howell 279]
MSSTTRPRPPDRSADGGSGDRRPRRRPVPRGRDSRARRLPASDAEPGIAVSALNVLSQQGYTVGEVMGRSTAPGAPRRGLDAQGRHVVIRVVDLPPGRGGAAVLRRLADLRVLRHPGLVTVREVVSLPEHRAGVITDLVDGAGLDVVLGARGRLNVHQLATLLDVLGSALAYLYEHGVAHGDVSAGNVLVTTDGRPVLIDLLGSVMETGTQDCAAPERLAGAPPSAASDVYALARLLIECAGRAGPGQAPGGPSGRRPGEGPCRSSEGPGSGGPCAAAGTDLPHRAARRRPARRRLPARGRPHPDADGRLQAQEQDEDEPRIEGGGRVPRRGRRSRPWWCAGLRPDSCGHTLGPRAASRRPAGSHLGAGGGTDHRGMPGRLGAGERARVVQTRMGARYGIEYAAKRARCFQRFPVSERLSFHPRECVRDRAGPQTDSRGRRGHGECGRHAVRGSRPRTDGRRRRCTRRHDGRPVARCRGRLAASR